MTSPYELARTTKIPRTTVYEIIMSLSLRCLIELERSDGLSKQQTRVKARNPSVLRSILWRRRDEMWKLESDLLGILPELKGDFHKAEANADFRFFPGIEGAREVYFGAEADGSDVPQIGWDYQTPMDAFGRQPIVRDVQEAIRVKMKLTQNPGELIPTQPWSRHVMTYEYGVNPLYIKATEYRYVNDPHWDLKQRITVKGNTIRIMCIEENETWGLIIRSQSFTKSLESLFNLMWVSAVPVTEEVVRSWGENQLLKADKRK